MVYVSNSQIILKTITPFKDVLSREINLDKDLEVSQIKLSSPSQRFIIVFYEASETIHIFDLESTDPERDISVLKNEKFKDLRVSDCIFVNNQQDYAYLACLDSSQRILLHAVLHWKDEKF